MRNGLITLMLLMTMVVVASGFVAFMWWQSLTESGNESYPGQGLARFLVSRSLPDSDEPAGPVNRLEAALRMGRNRPLRSKAFDLMLLALDTVASLYASLSVRQQQER